MSSVPLWQSFLILTFSPHDRILVYPCGDGSKCRELAAQVPLGLVVGMDPGDDQIRAARAASRDVDNIMYVCSDLREIPWKDGFFTHIFLSVAEESAELKRVLAEGGRLETL